MDLDVNALIKEIKDATSEIIKTDVTTAQGFAERQVKGIADHAANVAKGIANGEITSATRQRFLDKIVELSKTFAATIVGLTLVTIEKVWNKIVTLVMDAISAATGLAL